MLLFLCYSTYRVSSKHETLQGRLGFERMDSIEVDTANRWDFFSYINISRVLERIDRNMALPSSRSSSLAVVGAKGLALQPDPYGPCPFIDTV